MNRRNLFTVLTLVIISALSTFLYYDSITEPLSERSLKPNVIFIYADDLGRGLLSKEGQQIIKTPNIDKLANEGIRFERTYGSAFCAPARASLLTGYHDAHGDRWKITSGAAYMNILNGRLNQHEIETRLNLQTGSPADSEIFLPQVFKSAGYVTAEIGKLEWGFSTTDKQMKRHGWDYYYGYLDHVRCHGFYPPFLFENGNLVKIKGNNRINCGKSGEPETIETYKERWDDEGKSTYSQNIFLEKIIAFIKKNKDIPFFLYHPTQLPHGPVSIPKVHDDFVNNEELTQIEKEYASMVKMLDDHVGVIMQELKKQGIDDNTMVVFSSDNGHEIYYAQEERILKPTINMNTREPFDNVKTKFFSELAGDVFDGNDGMAGIKRSNWEGGVRVPLIARWPSHINPMTTSDKLIANYDFMATMAELVNVQIPVSQDGKSYLSELVGNEDEKKNKYVVFSSFMGPALVTQDGWKLRYYAPKKIFQLYYLPDDYQEKNDLSDIHTRKVDKLSKLLLNECNNDLDNGWFRPKRNILPSILNN